MDWGEITLRLGSAAVIGTGLGLNRYLHHKSIGVRTLGIVAVVSAAIVAATFEATNSDGATRVAQGIVTGIGFLGTGLFVHGVKGHSVHGLTTAATVWAAAVVGVLCGLAVWHYVVVTAVFIAIILTFGGRLEKWIALRFGDKEAPPQVPTDIEK